MTTEEIYAKAQRKIEALLEQYFPQRITPYFDRSRLTTDLLLVVATTGQEIGLEVFENVSKTYAPLVLHVGTDGKMPDGYNPPVGGTK